MKKLILAACFIATFSVCLLLQVFAEPINSVEVKNGVTIISGQLPISQAGQLVSIEVFKPNKNIDLIDYANPQLAINILNQFGQATTNAAGEYQYSYVNEGDSGSYLVRVSWYYSNAPFEKSFFYYSQIDIQTFIDNVNSCTSVDSMRSLLELNVGMIGIDAGIYNGLTEKNKNLIATAIVEHSDFTSIEQILAAYNTALLIQQINEAKDDLAYKSLIGLNRTRLALTNDGTYNRLMSIMDSQAVIDVQKKILGKSIYTSEGFKVAFEDSVIAVALERVKGWSEVFGMISAHNNILQIDLTDYNNLNEKSAVDKALAGKIFDTREQIVKAFNDAVKARKIVESNVGSVGGGKGGGNSTNISVEPSVLINKPDDEQQFNDLDSVPWAIESIRWLTYKGIVNGKGDGMFQPDEPITREEFTKMLIGIMNSVNENATVEFHDVDKNSWSYKYIASAYSIGLIKGNSDGTFGATRNITRQEMTALVYRMTTIKNIKLTNKYPSMLFADQDEISDYALQAITEMQKAGIVGGVGNGKFAPNDVASRAQAAKILYQLLGGNV